MNLHVSAYSHIFTTVVAKPDALAGFNESFRSTYFCRFCLATQTEMQTSDAVTDHF